ncbi:MAG TPA: hemerythrin domain-containing protein [Vulgatibacter sp.]|nr:hemerythrin domain-containing protein [Vulgatibacter sp.]
METIHDYMKADHERCDASFERAAGAARTGNLPTLAREFAAFLRRISVHIQAEERLLFPAIEERTGMSGGPTKVMNGEHRVMEALFERMQAAATGGDCDAYLRASEQVMQILAEHNQKEERMLYPMLDEAMGDDVGPLLAEVKAMFASVE